MLSCRSIRRLLKHFRFSSKSETLYLFGSAQFRTQNRWALLLKLL